MRPPAGPPPPYTPQLAATYQAKARQVMIIMKHFYIVLLPLFNVIYSHDTHREYYLIWKIKCIYKYKQRIYSENNIHTVPPMLNSTATT